ncbi:hypothetical protein BV898_04331 [Hypsibius exemplaris]|uniref:Solute carrier family 35 member F4 n=1 Tax=Hypsibius exemplaris TaxID=2072580 RepID=A0A1W0X358_HYPEX|nr:hypothetical protein BV898_04331 [Hypsibius exemplaris]
MKEETAKFLKTPAAGHNRTPVIIITSSSQSDIARDNNGENSYSADNEDLSDVHVDEMVTAPPEGEMVTERQARKNWIMALILLLIYITLVVTSSQLTSSAFNDVKFKQYKAPFLFVFCKVLMRCLAFPSVFLIQCCARLVKRQPIGAREQWRQSTAALRQHDGEGRIGVRIFLNKFFPMSITMLLMQIGWVVGLVHAPASIVTALCSATIAFSYLISWLVLKNKMLLIKGLFVIVAFTGIALISYASTVAQYARMETLGGGAANVSEDKLADAFENNDTGDGGPAVYSTTSFAGANVYLGIFCGISAAITYSLHSLAFKIAFKKTDLVQVSLIMSLMSAFICAMYLPVPVTLYLIGYENWEFAKMPLHIMFSSWFLAYISSVAYAYGLALSNPFFMSVGEVLIVALSTVIDAVVRKIGLNDLQIAGTALVALAFIFMVMPDPWVSLSLKRQNRRPEKEPKPNGEISAERLELHPKSPTKDIPSVRV